VAKVTSVVNAFVSKKKLYHMDTYNSSMSDVLHTSHISPPATATSHINVGKAERIASVLGGALLAYYGLQKSDKVGIAMAAAGGAMLFRGATGYCPMNEALGRDSSNGKDVALEITRSLTIGKPRSEVYQYWRQLVNLPRENRQLHEGSVYPIRQAI
jgi:uncharacterized membrane protein